MKNRKPLTNNNVENWHCRVTQDIRKNMTVNKCVELFRLKQNKMEGDLVRVMSGEVKKKRTAQDMKDEKIFVLVSSYKKEDLVLFLNSMSLNMGSLVHFLSILNMTQKLFFFETYRDFLL